MKVYHVKAARKDNSVAKKGEQYWFTTPRFGGKKLFNHYPRPSELSTGKKSCVLAAQESLSDAMDRISFDRSPEHHDAQSLFDEIEQAASDCADELEDLADQYEESADNMPESLQQGSQAETMREQADSLRSAASDLRSFDFSSPSEAPDAEDYDDDDDYESALSEWHDEIESVIESLKEEVTGVDIETMF